jgi:hypothetical protein
MRDRALRLTICDFGLVFDTGFHQTEKPMKALPRIPLLVLAGIGLLTVALLLTAAKGRAHTKRNGDLHLVIKMVDLDYNNPANYSSAVAKFDAALAGIGGDNSPRFFINYDPPPASPSNHPKQKGKLDKPCPIEGKKSNTNVTQQVSFLNTDDMAKFLYSAF